MTLLNPTVIVEVLSAGTEVYDRGRKFEHYQSIESLREYLLVASDRISASLYRRQSLRKASSNWNPPSAIWHYAIFMIASNCLPRAWPRHHFNVLAS